MDEASKQELRDRIAKHFWDTHYREHGGNNPWPDNANREPDCRWAYKHADFILPLIDRLITEAEGRVHAQAIAAAAAISETEIAKQFLAGHQSSDGHGPRCEIVSKYTRRAIQSLTRPAAELRARIKLARAVAEESEYWYRNHALGQSMNHQCTACQRFFDNNRILADLETKLAALDAKGGQ